MASDDDEALIARLRDAFSENVKSRSEAAANRRDIAAKVNSYLNYDEESEGLPARVVPPGKEITGIRQRYLEALRTNTDARERYHFTSSKKHQRDLSLQANVSKTQTDVVFTHLELALLVKRHQELEIRRRYVSTLSQDASTFCDLDVPLHRKVVMEVVDTIDESIAPSQVEGKALTAKLRKATLQTNHQLERQKVLLARTNQTQACTNPGEKKSRNRAQAIAATRNVLVGWLDEKLSSGGAEQVEESDPHEQSHDRAVPTGSITEHYQRYLVAREVVIEAGIKGSQALPVSQSTDSANVVLPTEEETLNSEDLFLAHAIKQRLAPLLQQRSNSITLQRYKSAQVAMERLTTLEILERLAEESHLLFTRPLGEVEGKDPIAQNIATWISAANTSSVSVAKATEQHHKNGLLAVKEAEVELAELMKYQNHETLPKQNDGIHWNGIHGDLDSRKVS